MTKYQLTKQMLKIVSVEVKQESPTDKLRIKQSINDYVDYLSKKCNLSEHYKSLLSNYACTLHP